MPSNSVSGRPGHVGPSVQQCSTRWRPRALRRRPFFRLLVVHSPTLRRNSYFDFPHKTLVVFFWVQTTFTFEKRIVTTSTDRGTTSTHTETSKEFPILSTSEMGQTSSETSPRDMIHTNSFDLKPFPFSLHLSFPTLAFILFGFLVQPLLFLLFTFHILPQPTAEKKLSSCIAQYSLSRSPSSLGKAPLSSSIPLCHVPLSFLRHDTSHLKHFLEP